MKSKYKVMNFLLALVFVFSLMGVEGNTQVLAKSAASQVDAQAMLQQACLDGGRGRAARADALTGFTQFIGTRAGEPMRVDSSLKGGGAEDVARGFMARCGGIFGLDDSNNALRTMRVTPSSDGRRSSVRFQQVYKDVPVVAGELIVQLDENQDILAVSGEMLPKISIDTTPKIDAESAKQRALGMVAKKYGMDASLLSTTEPDLWIYDAALLEPWDGPTQLVWRMEVTAEDINEFVLIGAERGDVVVSFSQIEYAMNRILYDYSSGGVTNGAGVITNPGAQICTESSFANCDQIATGGDDEDYSEAFVYSGAFYDYFFDNYGRDSYDNAGAAIKIVTKYTGDCNAFWDGTYMVIETGCTHNATDDTIGHELSHALTEYSANLFYYYQSGAINESMSDVFGEFIDQVTINAEFNDDSAGVKWQLFEDLDPGGLNQGPLRDMQDPTIYGDPDKMSSVDYHMIEGDMTAGGYDSGGVHTNSGVNNKAVYLMTDGDTFNSVTVAGIGMEKVSAIYYEALTQYLVSGSDYGDLYNAVQQACQSLTGTTPINAGSAISSADCTEVKKALDAVEMNTEPVADFNPDAPVCDTGYPLYRSVTDEAPRDWTSIWALTYLPITGSDYNYSHWYFINNYYAPSGVYSMWGDDFWDFGNATSDSYMTMRSKIFLPTSMPNAYFRFEHSYGFEQGGYDGGVVEYSLDNGKTWADLESFVGPAAVSGRDYNGTINSSTGNPLGTRSAFVNDSHGTVSTRYDISALKGLFVKFRFRMATDSAYSDIGWFVDNMAVYSCNPTNIVPTTMTFDSIRTQDGTVLETTERSNRGGTFNSGKYATVGDDSNKKQYRGILSFQTKNLPDNAIILDAKLYLYRETIGGGTPSPFLSLDDLGFGNLMIDMKKPKLGKFPTIEAADFQAKASKNVGIVDPALYPDKWHAAVLSGAVKLINLKGTTQVRIRFAKDDNNNTKANFIRFMANGGGSAPELVITYYIP